MSPTNPNILLLSSPTLELSSRLSETFLLSPLSPPEGFPDLTIVLGPFLPLPPTLPSPEHLAATTGTITSTLSQLENIVCRLLYLPSPLDPPQPSSTRLTPNSRNITKLKLPLTTSITITGLVQRLNVASVLTSLSSIDDSIADSDDSSSYDAYSKLIDDFVDGLSTIMVVNLIEMSHEGESLIPERILSVLKTTECQEVVRLVVLSGERKADVWVGKVRVVVVGVMGRGDAAVARFGGEGEERRVEEVEFKKF
ncbi:hypothetical protein TrVE_jg1246 [Triparma verrucosa]|uniref:Uncharacterized protein n=1 Tax=Triparma verrucosa TaxID=1606542 RepID=A0A9W7BWT5_9STRA|nr:hypothetical protein TrVE_jg1246 [Triparma verrucosa]